MNGASPFQRFRRGGRVVEGTGLENRQARKGLVGSNPTPSATLFTPNCDRAPRLTLLSPLCMPIEVRRSRPVLP